MPRVDVWVRKDDMAKWESIADKPEWLHEALNPSRMDSIKQNAVKPLNETLAKLVREPTCKHGFPTNGWSCKYGCKK